MATHCLTMVGYCPDWNRGPIEIKTPSRIEESSTPTAHYERISYANVASCIPIVNIIIGLWDTIGGIFDDGKYYNVEPEDVLKYKIIKFLVGLAELTLVGAWIVHGVATLYFYFTEPDRSIVPEINNTV